MDIDNIAQLKSLPTRPHIIVYRRAYASKSGMLRFVLRPLIVLFLLFGLSLSSFQLNATPLLSSKAIRVAQQARAKIFSPNGATPQEIEKAVETLEGLFSEPSFRRLDTGDQVDIILLLSSAYEQLGLWTKQDKLLSSYSRKHEFYRYYVALQIERARSYVIQDRFVEAENMLSLVMGKSCAQFPQEEKQKIAAVIAMKDKKLFRFVSRADQLKKQGLCQEAIPLYKTVLAAVQRNSYPFQASRVERKRLKYKINFALSEAYFSCGEYKEALSLLHERWEDDIFDSDMSFEYIQKRLFLTGLSHMGLHRFQEARSSFLSFLGLNGQKNPGWEMEAKLLSSYIASWDSEELPLYEEPPPSVWSDLPDPRLVFWNILFLLSSGEEAAARHIAFKLQSHWMEHGSLEPLREKEEIFYLILGYLSLYKGSFDEAKQCFRYIIEAAQKEAVHGQSYSPSIWHSMALHMLVDLYWDEASVYASFGNIESARKALRSIEALATEEKSELAYSRIALWTKLIEPLREATLEGEIASSSSIQEKKPVLSLFDDSIASIIPAEVSLRTLAIRSISSYMSAMCGDTSADTAISLLSKVCSGLDDPQGAAVFLHYICDLWLQSGQHHEAFQIIDHITQIAPSYSDLPRLIFHAIAATKSAADEYATPRKKAVHFLIGAYPDHPFCLLTSLLDDTALAYTLDYVQAGIKTNASPQSYPLVHFVRAVDMWKRAKTHFEEAERVKEPGVMKEHYQSSFALYAQASECMASLCSSFPAGSPESTPKTEHISPKKASLKGLLTRLLYTIEKEWLLYIFRAVSREEAAYNELPSLLVRARETISQHLHTLPAAGDEKELILASQTSLQELVELSPIYSFGFSGEIEEAQRVAYTILHQRKEISLPMAKGLFFLCQLLRESNQIEAEKEMLSFIDETSIQSLDHELSLSIAIEKALMWREKREYNKAMLHLAWVINGPYASSLRVRAMLIRADIYRDIDRIDLALRQLEAVATKGGEWARVAERKLEELAWR